MIKVNKIYMNYQEKQEGIVSVPQFGWIIESDRKNVVQASYHLQVAKDNMFLCIVHDSGNVLSEESAHVFINKINLESAQKYYVRVKVSDNHGEESDWSEAASFVTALLHKEEWIAQFVSAETMEDAGNSKGTYLRKTFVVKGKVKAAYAFTTALGLYKLFLNGARVASDELTPGWTSYHKHLLYQTYDVTESLVEGNNAIGALVGAGWYKGLMGFMGLRNNYGKQTAFLCQIMIQYDDGTSEIFASDSTWKGTDSPIIFSEIYDGEIYDARKEIVDWNTVACDDTTWNPVEIVSFDKSVLTAQGGCKVAEITQVLPKRIFTTPQGDTVIDFGQNLTGWIHFKVKGKEGDVVELNCFEVLDAKGNVYLENLRSAKERIVYTLRDSNDVSYHPNFTYQGFQYAKIASYPGIPKLEDFVGYAVHSDMESTGTFECSNPDLNQLQHNILWGLKGNFLDIPSDCPQRNERLGWTGDAQIFCRTSSYLMNTYPFFKKWLKDVAHDQTSEGGVPHIVPDIMTGADGSDWLLDQGTHSAAAWADVAVINPWTLYLTFGDKAILKDQYESMKAWINFMRTYSKDNIWNYKLQFGDWVALDAEEGSYFGATPNDLTCTAYYAYSTLLFSKMAHILGQEEDYKVYSELHQEIVKTFQTTFFDKDGIMTAQTQTAHIIALYFNLVPEEYQQKTIHGLLQLLEKENGHLVTGFIGTPYFCHALSQNGCTKEAYELLLKEDFPSWLYQIKMGATTVWEHWDGVKPDGTMWSPDMNSFNHYAYGAIGEWLYRVVAGIEIDEEKPGYKHSIIYPHIGGGLTYVKAEYKSVYGSIRVEWKTSGDNITLFVRIPHNTTATIILDHNTEVISDNGLAFVSDDSNMKAEAGSGEYEVLYKINL